MSQKVKKQASSLSFSMSRWFRRISTSKPSTFIISIIMIGATLFLFGGGLYDLANQPLVYAYSSTQQRFYFIVTRTLGGGLGEQFVSETAISLVLYAFGLAGLLAVYQSTKQAYNPRQAHIMLVVGVALLLLAYVLLEVVLNTKFS
jgi:hypothetical protein